MWDPRMHSFERSEGLYLGTVFPNARIWPTHLKCSSGSDSRVRRVCPVASMVELLMPG